MTFNLAAPVEAGSIMIDQAVAKPLVIPFALVVLDVFADDLPKMAFAERNHLPDAL